MDFWTLVGALVLAFIVIPIALYLLILLGALVAYGVRYIVYKVNKHKENK